MKIVVFGPFKRTGALHGESVVDLSRAYAKYLQERTVEPNPLEMADVVVPSDLVRLIEGGPRALEAAQQALDYLFGEAQNNLGPRGERLVHRARGTPQTRCARRSGAARRSRGRFVDDSLLEGRRFEPSVPRTSDNAFRDCSTAPAIPLPRQRPAPSRQCAEARRRRAGGHFLGRPLTAVPRCSRQRAMASRERSDVVAITGHDECRRASLECPSLAGVNGVGTPCCVPRL
jgi:hypothetical protein